MAMTAGTRIGSYEVVAAIGAGGMGEVYRARDTKLQRDVALKILPEAFATDRERLARFEREARVLASLNHPQIAAIYGVEEGSAEGGVFGDSGPGASSRPIRALVMELVDGDTLADRIARGPIPPDEALPIARQIAEALEAAHEQGVIHRDLKPANIKVRDDGTVKVLDFGLAKLNATNGSSLPQGPTLSPTITSPALLTGVGVMLGTAAYMSPEQAKGKDADKRSDMWAFGCVLFEMLTGKRAFGGEDITDTIAAVMRDEPDWAALPASVSPSLRSLLRRCLERDRKRRIADPSTVLFVLDNPAEPPAPDPAASWWRRAAVAGIFTTLAAGAAAGFLLSTLRSENAVQPRRGTLARFWVALPNTDRWSSSPSHIIAMSPDGTAVAYTANDRLYIRTLADTEPRLVQGTGVTVDTPFFSPDGHWVGFYVPSERKLKKIALTGGPPLTICDAELVYGATWSADDRIYFGQAQRGLLRVAAAGGTPEVIVTRTVGEIMHGPQALPGGDVVLFTLASARSTIGWDRARIVAQSLKTGERTVIVEGGSDARYVRTGHLLYAVGSTVLAVPFDVNGLKATGAAVPVLEGVARSTPGRIGTGAGQFGVSDTGTLTYIPAANSTTNLAVALVDRTGRRKALTLPPGQYGNVRFSPTGKQLAMQIDDGRESAVWIYDVAGSTSARRLTFEGRNTRPTWTPDGQRIAYRSELGAGSEQTVAWQAADGSGPAERIGVAESATTLQPEAWTPDGHTLLLSVSTVGGGERSLATLRPGRDARPTPLVPTYATNSSLSPDGRWFAYYADLGDHNAIFVQPYPPTGAKYLLPGDGRDPLFSPDGTHLFFLRNTRSSAELMSVPVYTAAGLSFGEPEKVGIDGINSVGARSYDVAPDGRSFAAVVATPVTDEPNRSDRFQITLDWFEELRQRVPMTAR